jgi:hypothetical protein
MSAVVWLYATRVAEPSGWEWPWVAVGVVLVVIGAGPIASTSVGRSFRDWFRDIGGIGRIIVVALSAVGLFGVEQLLAIPSRISLSVVNGGLIGIVVLVSVSILRAGGVSGWR